MTNYLKKRQYPSTSVGTPGTPGTPYRAGYYTYTTVPQRAPNQNTVPIKWHLDGTSYDPISDTQGSVVVHPIGIDLNQYTLDYSQPPPLKIAVWVPPVQAVPPIPGTPPAYPPSAWDSGAQAIATLGDDGDFLCQVDAGVGGVCVGFSSRNSVNPKDINFGLYCHNGLAQGFYSDGIHPMVTSAAAPYLPSDVWTLRRRLGVATLLKNGSLIYTLPTSLYGGQTIQGSLFAPYDVIRNASIQADQHGVLAGRFQNLQAVIGISTQNRGTKFGAFRPLQGVISARARGAVPGTFQKMLGSLGEPEATLRGSFQKLQGLAEAGNFTPGPPQSVDGQFLPFQADLHMLTGGVGSVTGTLPYFQGMLGRAGQGNVSGSFLNLQGRAFAYAPGQVYIDSYAAGSMEMSVEQFLVVSLDSEGIAVDAWLVNVTSTPGATAIDSTGTAIWDWIVNRVDVAKFESKAFAHDLMATGVIIAAPGDPIYGVGGSGVDPSSGGTSSGGQGGVGVGGGDGTGTGGTGGTTGGSGGTGGGTGGTGGTGGQGGTGNSGSGSTVGGGTSSGSNSAGIAVWALNVDTNASSRYDNYVFQSLATRQGRLYGTKPDGVYLLEGDDDAGAPILASFATGNLNFPSDKDPAQAGALKRFASIYMGVAADKSMYLKIVSGGREFLYVSRTSNANMMQQRVDPGLGLRSTYYSFEVYNQQGSDFDLESIEFIPIKLSRRV